MKRLLETTIIIACVVGLIVLIVLCVEGYLFNWDWTGLSPYISPPHPKDSNFQRGKTLWDWLQLLIIPAVLAVAGYVINLTISRGEQEATEQRAKSEREAVEKRAETEREIALDNQREAALQEYIDKMSELLLHEQLADELPSNPQVQVIARARTATVLRTLDPVRRGSLIRFLSQGGILVKCTEKAMAGLDLHGADLSRLNLSSTNLSAADLSGAFLSESDLSEAFLIKAKLWEAFLFATNLSGADLTGADLSGADLIGALLIRANLYSANLTNANLNGANLKGAYNTSKEQLEQARSLIGATMPDGSIHP